MYAQVMSTKACGHATLVAEKVVVPAYACFVRELQMKLIHVRLRMLGAGSTVISGGLGALGSLAASWLLAGATGSHALVLLGRTGRLRLGGGMSFSGPPNQAGLLAYAHMLALLLCMVFRHILLQGMCTCRLW